ncbi:replication initiation protein [Enterococcus sp. BWR-S5]|uniref:replication initiation protein n=1 Tax=Enterococcus sp. BWR-S5 TaxID=2787714 RepID=UPI001920F048|nr:RepB family plasmid replication initiator protein [Enterococcus sp. BWR-S5]MBL1227227.1 RepB family plasmid replication initiator protein [Enterococcus sp. BWR-S5]
MSTSDFSLSNKVAQHNDLITSVSTLNIVPLKIFEIIVSCVDTKNPKREITLRKDDIYAVFETKSTAKSNYFKNHLHTVMQQGMIIELPNEKEAIVLLSSYAEWEKNGDLLTIELNERIMPFLIGLKDNFTQYPISEIIHLNTKYAIILYKWLSMNLRMFEEYRNKKFENPCISIEEFRTMANVQNKYTDNRNLDRAVIKKAIADINKQTSINVEYEKMKKGNLIYGFSFHISRKKVAPELKNPEILEQKELSDSEIYAESLQSKYTDYLLELMLIAPTTLRDRKVMIRLYKQVYSLYDQMRELLPKGYREIREHLIDLKENMIPAEEGKENIVKYLRVSAEGQLEKLKIMAAVSIDGYVVNEKGPRFDQHSAEVANDVTIY